MLKQNFGKLMVYASNISQRRKRVESVKSAAQKTARQLNLQFEMVKLKNSNSPTYVYYEESENDDLIPIYCDEGKMSGLEEIGSALRQMMFVLSLHPKHSALAHMRGEILKLS